MASPQCVCVSKIEHAGACSMGKHLIGGKSTLQALLTLLDHRGIHEQEASAFFFVGACERINDILHMCMCARTHMTLNMEYRGQAFNLYKPSTRAHTSPGLIIASVQAIQKR